MKRILVIDDDEAVRDAFSLALERLPHEVRCAADGAQGLSEAGAHPPDLVFLDLKMPGMNGVEVLRRLRDLDARVPVYIVTGFQQEFLRELRAAREEGLRFEVADKPLSAPQIRQIAAGALPGEGV